MSIFWIIRVDLAASPFAVYRLSTDPQRGGNPGDTAGHLCNRPPREGHRQDAARVCAIDDQVDHLRASVLVLPDPAPAITLLKSSGVPAPGARAHCHRSPASRSVRATRLQRSSGSSGRGSCRTGSRRHSQPSQANKLQRGQYPRPQSQPCSQSPWTCASMITRSRPGARLESLARRTAPRASKTSTIERWTTGGRCRLSVRFKRSQTSAYHVMLSTALRRLHLPPQ